MVFNAPEASHVMGITRIIILTVSFGSAHTLYFLKNIYLHTLTMLNTTLNILSVLNTLNNCTWIFK